MEGIIRQIRSRNDGMTILIALFYFLVCACVGAVVLTAATTVTGRLANYQQSQQAYYSTTSAAQLFRDAIVNGTCEVSGSGNDTVWTCALPVKEGSSETSTGTSNAGTNLASWLARQAKNPYSKATSLTVKLGNNANVIDVTANIIMNDDYSLHVSLQPVDYQGAVGNYRVECDIPAALTYAADQKTVQKITWQQAIISKPILSTGKGN